MIKDPMQKYTIHGETVTPFEITLPMNSPIGKSFTKNVLIYKGVQHDVYWNGMGDGKIIVDGHKLYLEWKN